MTEVLKQLIGRLYNIVIYFFCGQRRYGLLLLLSRPRYWVEIRVFPLLLLFCGVFRLRGTSPFHCKQLSICVSCEFRSTVCRKTTGLKM